MQKKILLNTLLIVVLMFLVIHIYHLFRYKYIAIEFTDLRPMREKIDIFYKGIKIGYVRDMKLCHSCKSTLVKCVLTYNDLLLPENTTALMKKEKKKDKEYDFIELQYPSQPVKTMIANGSVLQGKTTVDIIHFMSNQNGDELDDIKNNLVRSSAELEAVMNSLVELFSLMQDILKQNRKNIYYSTQNLSNTTQNFMQLSEKLDTSISQSELKKSIANLSDTTDNLKTVTTVLGTTGSSLNEQMVPQIQSTLYRTECLVANTNELVCGVKETMKKRFGGIRLLFGKTFSTKNIKQ